MTTARRVVICILGAVALVALVLVLAYAFFVGGEGSGGVQTTEITTTG